MEATAVGPAKSDLAETKEGIFETPSEIYPKLTEDVRQVKEDKKPLNTDRFLSNIDKLDKTGVIDRVGVLKDKVFSFGEDPDLAPALWKAVFIKTLNSVRENDAAGVRENLRLAHLLGMDQTSANPARQMAVEKIRLWNQIFAEVVLAEIPSQPVIQEETAKTAARPRAKRRPRIGLRTVAGVLTAAAVASPFVARQVNERATPPPIEVRVPGRTYTPGTLNTDQPTYFKPGTNEVVSLTSTRKTIELVHPAGNGRFTVWTPQGEFEIPMEQVAVSENARFSWEKEENRVEGFGFDAYESPEMIDRAAELGASIVRIPLEEANDQFFKNRPETKAAIKRAKEKNLKIMLLYNPHMEIGRDDASRRIDNILALVGDYGKVSFVIGNEPDMSAHWDHWQDQNYKQYAAFVKQSVELFEQKRPGSELIIGTTAQRELIGNVVKAVKNAGLDINKLTFALNGYHTVENIQKRIERLKAAAGPDVKFIFGELGTNNSDKEKAEILPQMINAARAGGAREVIVFKLANSEFSTSDKGKFGFVSAPGGQLEKPAWKFVDYAWMQKHTPSAKQ